MLTQADIIREAGAAGFKAEPLEVESTQCQEALWAHGRCHRPSAIDRFIVKLRQGTAFGFGVDVSLRSLIA